MKTNEQTQSKISNHLLRSCSAVDFIATLLLIALSAELSAQSTLTSIPIGIWGEAIVACSSGPGMYDYAATGGAIYARSSNKSSSFENVWKAPGGLRIVSFSNKNENGNDFRAVLLRDDAGKGFICYNRINANSDSTICGPVLLASAPDFTGITHNKIIAGKNLYVLANNGNSPGLGFLSSSRDNGLTWLVDSVGLSPNEFTHFGFLGRIFDIAVDTQLNVFATTPDGLFKQSAADSVWHLVNGLPTGDSMAGLQVLYIDVQNRIIGGADVFAYISNDNGATFRADTLSPWFMDIDSTFIFFDGTTVKYITGDDKGDLYIYTRNDYASTGHLYYNASGSVGNWKRVDSVPSALLNNMVNCFSAADLIQIGNSQGAFVSEDRGLNWQGETINIQAENIYSIVEQSNGNILVSTDKGVFYKNPTGGYHNANLPGFVPGMLLRIDNRDNIYALPPLPLPACVFPDITPPAKTADGGQTWVLESVGFGNVGGEDLYIDENGTRYSCNTFVAQYPQLLWSSAQGSSTWAVDDVGLPQLGNWGNGITGICSDYKGYIYLAITKFQGYYGQVFRRPINGGPWVLDTIGLGADFVTPALLTTSHKLGVICAADNQIFRRGDRDWEIIPMVPGMNRVKAISVDDNGVIYVSATCTAFNDSNEVFFTTDAGETWQPLGMMGMNTHTFTSTCNTTYALTLGNWGYVIKTAEITTGIIQVERQPVDISVFPNPSASGVWNLQNGEEWIGGNVEVVDMRGRSVYSGLVNTSATAIVTTGLPQGVYLLRVFKDGREVVRRVEK